MPERVCFTFFVFTRGYREGEGVDTVGHQYDGPNGRNIRQRFTGNEESGRIGEGNHTIQLKTTSGDITVTP